MYSITATPGLCFQCQGTLSEYNEEEIMLYWAENSKLSFRLVTDRDSGLFQIWPGRGWDGGRGREGGPGPGGDGGRGRGGGAGGPLCPGWAHAGLHHHYKIHHPHRHVHRLYNPQYNFIEASSSKS